MEQNKPQTEQELTSRPLCAARSWQTCAKRS